MSLENVAEENDETPPANDDSAEFSADEIFHILQNDRRRAVLRYLQDRNDPVRMRDVAEQVAAWEHDTTVEGLSSTQRQRVYIPLYQSHLPKLDKAGIIDYQQSRGIVERKPLADVFDPYLDAEAATTASAGAIRNDDPEWDDYYLAIAAIGSFLLVGSVLELPVVGTLSGIAVALVLLVMITGLTVRRHLDF